MLLQICTEFFCTLLWFSGPLVFLLRSQLFLSFFHVLPFFTNSHLFPMILLYLLPWHATFFHLFSVGYSLPLRKTKQTRTRHPKQTKTTQTPKVNSSFLSNFWLNNCVAYIHQLETGVKAYLRPYHHYSLNHTHKPDSSVSIVFYFRSLFIVPHPSAWCFGTVSYVRTCLLVPVLLKKCGFSEIIQGK